VWAGPRLCGTQQVELVVSTGWWQVAGRGADTVDEAHTDVCNHGNGSERQTASGGGRPAVRVHEGHRTERKYLQPQKYDKQFYCDAII